MNMTNRSRGAAVGTIALLLMIGAPVQAADNPQVAAEVMALARAQWASEIANEPMAQQNVSLAEDYTEFNGEFPDPARRQDHGHPHGRGRALR